MTNKSLYAAMASSAITNGWDTAIEQGQAHRGGSYADGVTAAREWAVESITSAMECVLIDEGVTGARREKFMGRDYAKHHAAVKALVLSGM